MTLPPYGQDPGGYEPRTQPLGPPAAPVPQPYYQPRPPMPPTQHMPPQPYLAPISPPPLASQNMVVVQQTPRTTSAYATASLVFGILGLVTSCCTFGVFSLIAVIFGHVALGETKHGARGGHGSAVAGLILGYLIVVPAVIFSITVVFGGGLGALNPSPTATP